MSEKTQSNIKLIQEILNTKIPEEKKLEFAKLLTETHDEKQIDEKDFKVVYYNSGEFHFCEFKIMIKNVEIKLRILDSYHRIKPNEKDCLRIEGHDSSDYTIFTFEFKKTPNINCYIMNLDCSHIPEEFINNSDEIKKIITEYAEKYYDHPIRKTKKSEYDNSISQIKGIINNYFQNKK